MTRVPGLLCGLLFALCGAVLCAACSEESTFHIPDLLEIEVVGKDFGWVVHYPGADGRLGTADDKVGARDVHIPSGTRVMIHLRSCDYVYGFALPELDLKDVAVPELEFALEVPPTEPGILELRGNQMCGFTHPDLIGRLVVEPRAAFIKTLSRLKH